MADHQFLKDLELKNHSKTAIFDQKQQFLSGFLALAPLKLDGRQPNPLIWVMGFPPDTQVPMGTLGKVE